MSRYINIWSLCPGEYQTTNEYKRKKSLCSFYRALKKNDTEYEKPIDLCGIKVQFRTKKLRMDH